MKSGISATAVILASLATQASAQWTQIWADEFDGTELNLSNWEYMIGDGTAYGNPGWGNNELQYYTNFARNATVSDGTLKIKAIRENFGGKQYTSARIRTQNKVDFLYGRIESRMKLPSTSGVWPALWMLPTNSPYGGWAASGEIDLMESVNYADRMYGTLHYGSNWPNNQHAGGSLVTGLDYGDDFHVFVTEWEPDTIRWYVDGQLFHTATYNQWFSSAAPSNPRAPFDSPFHLLLNVAVGGNFPGNPDGSAQYPQTFEIDYVRVYQHERAPFAGSAASIPGQIEAEDYDRGYSGVAFRDSTSGNEGGQYRDDDVDVEVCSEGGHNVAWIRPQEWMEYTVDVASAGEYRLELRVASPQVGGPFNVKFNGVDSTGQMLVPITGDYQNWMTIEKIVNLEAGPQAMRVTTEGGSGNFNLNWIRLSRVGGCSPADLAEPFGALNFFDISEFISLFNDQDPTADLAAPFGAYNFFDLSEYITQYNAGCP